MEKLAITVTWINWLSMAMLGGYSVIANLANFVEFIRLVISGYICAFGVVGLLFEVRVTGVVDTFPFLEGRFGKAMFFIFVGTLGMSFGWQTAPATHIIPFLVGLFSLIAGLILVTSTCTRKARSMGGDEYQPLADPPPQRAAADVGPNAL